MPNPPARQFDDRHTNCMVQGMTLIQPSYSLARLMTRWTVLAALFLIGPVAVAELSVKLLALTGALLEEDGR